MKALPCVSSSTFAGAWLVAAASLLPAASAADAPPAAGRRSALAVTYAEGSSTRVDMVGSAARPGSRGEARVTRQQGRTRVRLHMDALPHPQALGSFYTTYLLWAVAPEGQAANLAELPHSKRFDVVVTTSFQTFGLIVTAEPHSAVSLPSPLILAENAARDDTVGRFHSGTVAYGGAVGALYEANGGGARDYATPLPVLGARHAVALARDAGAATYDAGQLERAQAKLEALERAWPHSRKLPKDLDGLARDVMRLAEHARAVAEHGREQDRLAAERRAAGVRVAQAQTEAERARDQAQQAQARAALEQERADAARQEAAREQQRAAEARDQAERARAGEEQARLAREQALGQAEAARREAERVRLEKEALQQRLLASLSEILETRREARGLIVSLSDVLFDFGRTSLTPGAREKLSRLAGILTAYPSQFRLEFEGHTDAIGTAEHNLSLSVGRAESVRGYLLQAGVPPECVGRAVGFGADRPVASNDSPSGRQMNRRVEIVVNEVPARSARAERGQ